MDSTIYLEAVKGSYFPLDQGEMLSKCLVFKKQVGHTDLLLSRLKNDHSENLSG